ncbi:oxidoreductase [Subtercola boreus]|uniref:Oxidoreductase n=1 Tax=Subtercola boreus TaxID=120213 RepID=A0A3E0W2Z9_9MICO|nr:Gfo/Idh/MocA family oxidoreductase [Subtercola boreus]RFA15948.1 oxidoreductase [Subtercola boreus]
MPHSAVRVGIIGGGFMAAVHSRAARAAGATVVGIASSSPVRSERAAGLLGIETGYDSADSLIADSDADVIHICTPNSTHAALATAVITAGKHVVCEKPLTAQFADAEPLAELAERAGVVAAVPFVYRYHPMIQELQARVLAGDLGRVITVRGSYLQDWLMEETDGNWRVHVDAGGRSRAFADIGSHLLDLAEFVTGSRVVEVAAATSTVYPVRNGEPVDTEDIAAVTARFDNDAVASLLVSQTAGGHDNDLQIEVMGTHASASFSQERPDSLAIGTRGSVTTLSRGGPTLAPTAQALSLVPPGHPMGYQDAFNAFARDVYAAVKGDMRSRLPTFADGARMSRVTETVLNAAATHSWISIR